MRKVYSHGELCVFSGSEIPKGALLLKPKNNKYVVAKSEVTGNDHCLEAKEGVELYEKDGVMYLKAEVAVDVFCVIEERHDRITLEPGIYEMEPAKEWDYLEGMKRSVAD